MWFCLTPFVRATYNPSKQLEHIGLNVCTRNYNTSGILFVSGKYTYHY
ncbi:uncharacterized protein ARMOST_13664 [Armillaria ostoyae]|uniref:Uncharacterized protein n=1 Tax=Armillaria ostoyae TaxID=47428 RepID=A0A284RNE3_ARMOS|nr:uncharacterized protein ARMOST_13664 [Armillaria ostoyae]